MAEKRFTYLDASKNHYIGSFFCNEVPLTNKEVFDLLNENEQLKSEIEKLSYANEDLLSEKRNWQRMSDEYCKLSEENEQLKEQNRQLRLENSKLTHVVFWTNKKNEEELQE